VTDAMTPAPPTDVAVGRGFLKLGGGEAAARGISFAVTVYLARMLGAPMYGIVVLAITVLRYLYVLADCGVEALGVRNVAADRDALPEALPSILGARVAVAAALTVATALTGLFILPQPDGAILAAFAFTLGTVALGTRWVHLGFEQHGFASVSRMLTEATAAVLIVALVHAPGDLGMVPLAQIIGEGLGAVLLFRLLPPRLRKLRVAIHPGVVRSLFRASWPLMLNAFLGLAIFNSDFLFLRAFRDSAAVGLYAAAYTLVSFFLNLGEAYGMSLLPAMTRLRDDPTAEKSVYDRSMVQVLAGAVPLAVGGFLVAGPLVHLIFGARYSGSAAPLQLLMCSIPMGLIRNVSTGALISRGRQDLLLRTVVWAAGLNVVLNLGLIPVWGMMGAAAATLTTEIIRAILGVRYVARLGIPMTPFASFRRVLFATAIMAAVVAFVAHAAVPLAVAAGGVTYVGALTLVGGLRFRRGALPEIVA
jgi:O-antigen/teichoic acid export membrane protein